MLSISTKKKVPPGEKMNAASLPLCGRQKPLKPKEKQVQGFRVVCVPTGKSISSAPSLFCTWHLNGGISRCLLEGEPFGGPSGQARSRADLWHRRRHYRKHEDQAEEMPQQPRPAFPPVSKHCGLGRLLQAQCARPSCPGRASDNTFL